MLGITNKSELIKLLLLVSFFVLAIFISTTYKEEIVQYLDFGYWGMFVYVSLATISTVVAPINTLPLIPVATALWGGFISALLSITAWTLGAIIAFIIARRLGKPFIEKHYDLEKISRYEKLLGDKYVFWNIVALRIMIPVDILSYAIGLFTSIKLSTYSLATLIGVSPFAFLLAYSATFPLPLQIGVGVLVLLTIYLGYRKIKNLAS
ncbi:MAG: TVP38/TMEM64 family protein [Candidatus Pacebacteria bacterium]|nr:TVP38/TMEM64 family protein [Candidatus Paceibacterota bacterium]